MNPVLLVTAAATAALAAGSTPQPAPVVTQFDFPFPTCQGVTAADNPFHVTTTSDPGQPRTDTHPAGELTVSTFTDSGSYVARPSVAGDRVRAGRYLDRYEAVAGGPVKLDGTGAIATAGWLVERRDIELWDGRRFFFHETWLINVNNYDEATTVPVVTDRCGQ